MFNVATRKQPSNVVLLRANQTKTNQRQKSLYEIYPLQFFDRETRNMWAVQPTGDYENDCETGKKYARQFLNLNDGTPGWSSLLRGIVGGMVRAGPDKIWPDGEAKLNGIAIGFLTTVGKALAASAEE
jgi:hypothetical protein